MAFADEVAGGDGGGAATDVAGTPRSVDRGAGVSAGNSGAGHAVNVGNFVSGIAGIVSALSFEDGARIGWNP